MLVLSAKKVLKCNRKSHKLNEIVNIFVSRLSEVSTGDNSNIITGEPSGERSVMLIWDSDLFW